ncbi:MAG: protein kinase [Vicinamibacteria bacterium]|nr:protein kinase [Vicinamibacteria bacterium]
MQAERWEQVRALFTEARDRPEGERAAWLTAACAGDADLEREVQSLLAHDHDGDDLATGGAAAELVADDLIGTALGPYRVIAELGRGGMGRVYLAAREDGAYAQQVAIKVIHRGMDTEAVLRRFRTERQILATLVHPNVARLLDGGSLPDGRPYLVMEHVAGDRLDAWCDARSLGVEARVRLVLDVCSAVSLAHRRLVVHRDIKPGNVLVTAEGVPKLLDFGIAKLLDPEADGQTTTGHSLRLLTPDYASPEQVRGEPITTATDVYALGVLLYELLTGQRPRPATGTLGALEATFSGEPRRASRAVHEGDGAERAAAARAARPEALSRRLAGDLDVILATALRKEPERRYASVDALADDLRRHLAGLPVLARGDSVAYRAGRFVSRHRVPVAAAAMAAFSLAAGAGIAWQQARVAREQRAVAERRQQDSLRLTNAMLFELFEGMDQGPQAARKLLVARALGYLDTLSREVPEDPALLHELASAYGRLAEVQAGVRESAGTAEAGARASFDKAVALRERLASLAPQHAENRREQGRLLVALATDEGARGRPARAVELLDRALELLGEEVAARPADREARRQLMRAHSNMAAALGAVDALAGVGRPADALPHLDAAIGLAEALLAEAPDDADARGFLGVLFNASAAALVRVGRPEEARQRQLQAIAIAEGLVERHPDSAHYRRELAVGYGNLAAEELAAGKPAQALELTRRALPLYEALVQAAPQDDNARRDLALGHRNVGRALWASGDPRGATPHLERARELLSALTAEFPDSAFLARQLAFTHLVIAQNLLASGQRAASGAEALRGIRIAQRLVEADASNMTAWRTLAQAQTHVAKLETSGSARACAAWGRSRDAWRRLDAAGEKDAAALPLAEAERALADCPA